MASDYVLDSTDIQEHGMFQMKCGWQYTHRDSLDIKQGKCSPPLKADRTSAKDPIATLPTFAESGPLP